MRKPLVHCLVGLILIVTAVTAGAQEARDMKLEDAGFVIRAATTPRQVERHRILPPRIFVARPKAGKRTYLYADPAGCRCVFGGNETALRTFRDRTGKRSDLDLPAFYRSSGLSSEGEVIQSMDEDAGTLEPDDILDYRF